MNIKIESLRPSKGAVKNKKRVGRGNSSGHGTYSGRGQKGQRSRAGVSNLKRLGMKQVLLRTPKKKGFKSDKIKAQIVNLAAINRHYKDKETVSPNTLFKRGLVDNMNIAVKILGQGELTVKELHFQNVKMSEKARQQAEKSKGQVAEK